MKKRLMIALCMGIMHTYSLDFIDAHLEDFIKRVVLQEYQQEFSEYYKNFLAKIESMSVSSSDKKNAELHRLRTRAYCSLENMHPDWAQQLKPFAFYEKDASPSDSQECKSIRIFLTRYAAYDEFLKEQAQKRSGLWYRFKSYSKHMSSKVSHWINGWRSKKKAV